MAITISQRWSRSEIQQFLAHASCILRSKQCDVRVAPTASLGRLLLVVPAHTGTAVERNTVKRRLRALFTEHHLATRGFDWGIFIKRAGIRLSYHQLVTIIEPLCK